VVVLCAGLPAARTPRGRARDTGRAGDGEGDGWGEVGRGLGAGALRGKTNPPSPHATPLRYALVATVSRTPPGNAAATSLPEIWGGRMGEGGSRPRTGRTPGPPPPRSDTQAVSVLSAWLGSGAVRSLTPGRRDPHPTHPGANNPGPSPRGRARPTRPPPLGHTRRARRSTTHTHHRHTVCPWPPVGQARVRLAVSLRCPPTQRQAPGAPRRGGWAPPLPSHPLPRSSYETHIHPFQLIDTLAEWLRRRPAIRLLCCCETSTKRGG
jgi:hypothetical protein